MEQVTREQPLHGLSDAEYTALGAKLQGFYNGLSSNEQAVLNDNLRRLIPVIEGTGARCIRNGEKSWNTQWPRMQSLRAS